MEPMTIMALLSAGQGLLGAGQKISGAAQRRKAQRDFKGYEIPSGVKGMLGMLQGMASQRELPGADITRQRLGATTAQGVETAQRTAQSPSDVLGALQGIYGNQMEAEQNLSIAGAQQYQRNQLQLAQGLQTLGGYQAQKWQFNELYPYMQKMSAAGQADAAGGANISGAIGSGINIMGAQATLQHQEKMFDDWKNTTIGQEPANPWGRTAEQESALRGLQPKAASELTPRTIPPMQGGEPSPTPYSNAPWTPYRSY